MQKCKNRSIPKSPLTLAGVEAAFNDPNTMKRFGFNLNIPRQPFYRATVRNQKFGFTVFSSFIITEAIISSSENHYHIDGTFGVLPNNEFKQLLVIHLELKGHVSFNFEFTEITCIINLNLYYCRASCCVCAHDEAHEKCIHCSF